MPRRRKPSPRSNPPREAVRSDVAPARHGRFIRAPVIRFVIIFAALMAMFAGFFYGFLIESRPFQHYLNLNASVSAGFLRLMGDEAFAFEDLLQSRTTNFSVQIRHGCDAILPAGLFMTAVLAFPVSWHRKWPGMIAGTATLLLLNFVRILSLYYTGVHWPNLFHTMHVDVWQPAFIVIVLFLWVWWALWATKPRTSAVAVEQHGAS